MKILKPIIFLLCFTLIFSMTSCVPHSEYGSENYNTIDFVGTHCMRQYTCTNGKQYFYYVAGKIYEFQEGKKDIVVTEQVGEIQGMACNEKYLYFSDGDLYQIDLKSKKKIELNNSGNVTGIAINQSNIFYCQKIIYNKSGSTSDSYADIYALNEKDSSQKAVKLNDLLLSRDFSPENEKEIQDTQELHYKEYLLSAYYNQNFKHYEIDSIFNQKGQLIASFPTIPCQVTLSYERGPLTVKRGGFKQGITGDWKENKVLQGATYDEGGVFGLHSTVMNQQIVQLIQIASGYEMLGFNPTQTFSEFDYLVTWSPQNPERKILYRTRNEKTKIIGYINDQVYLYRDNQVIQRDLAAEKEKVVCKLPKETYMLFDWCDGKLFIFGGEDEENARLLEVVSK